MMQPPERLPVATPEKSLLKRRAFYLVGAWGAMILGLASRRHAEWLPVWIAHYAGDTLWAAMVFFGVSFLFPGRSVRVRAGGSLALATMIEISQLYQAQWIELVRQTRLGGLVLGFDFLWTDLVCYAAGVAVASALDGYLIRGRPKEPCQDERVA